MRTLGRWLVLMLATLATLAAVWLTARMFEDESSVDEFWGTLWVLGFVIGYALICRFVAEFANSKGYSYWGVALFSFFFTPVLGALLAFLVPERTGPNRAPQRNPARLRTRL